MHARWERTIAIAAVLGFVAACSDDDAADDAAEAPAAGDTAVERSTTSPDTGAPSTAAPSTSSSGTEPGGGVTPTTAAVPTGVSWQADADTVSDPVVVGSTAAFYSVDDSGAFVLVAVDVGTGEERWRSDAAVSAVFGGIVLEPLAAGPVIVGLAPDPQPIDDRFVAVTGYDPATGAVTWTSRPMFLNVPPRICGPAVVCVHGNAAPPDDPNQAIELRIDAATGEEIGRTVAPLPAEADLLEERIYRYEGADGTVMIGYVSEDGGSLLWEIPFATMTAGRPVDSGRGYDVRVDTASETMIAGFGPAVVEGPTFDHDRAAQAVFGIDLATGAARWVADGVTLDCLAQLPVARDGTDGWLWCRETGIEHYIANDEDAYDLASHTPYSAAIERFDPATGTPLSSTPIDVPAHVGTPGEPGTATFPIGRLDRSLVAPSAGSVVLIDVDTGTNTPADPTAIVWCPTPRRPFTITGLEPRVGGGGWQPCTAAALTPATDLPAAPIGRPTPSGAVWSDGSHVLGLTT
jgi:hypothetical protein